jgi:predicted GIY-YIG superfamily endonuclease
MREQNKLNLVHNVNMNHYVYIVVCRDGSLYTGYTLNIKNRIYQHNFTKSGAKSIRGKLPVELAYSEMYTTKSEALKREKEIKSWSRKKKLELIK